MVIEIQTAIIAAIVALLTASVSGYISWIQIKREKMKWLAEIKGSYTLELYKTRLSEYPKIIEVLEKISTASSDPLTPDNAKQIARHLNQWFYSAGGLVADARTRGAILGLRDACSNWTNGPLPSEIREWRTTVMHLLRRDLDLISKPAYDPEDRASLLEKIKTEIFDYK